MPRILRTRRGRTPRAVCHRRRGTALVFVLGILTLMALVGLVLITRTHGELKRVALDASATNVEAAMDGVVRVVRETLRRDIWGTLTNPARPFEEDPAAGPWVERNEPFDAPGEEDRWLASTLPHIILDEDISSPTFGEPLAVPTGRANPPPFDILNTEEYVPAWHRVSYLGTDIIRETGFTQPGYGNQFRWLNLSRPYAPEDWPFMITYDDGDLQETPILQTEPPTGFGSGLIPGSTTTVTIAEARAQWEYELTGPTGLQTALGSSLAPRFPYFDTNADGLLDLYDADGDGIPDSPLSFPVQVDTPDPNAPKRLYAAIRIVDHASMLNANVASSLRLPSNPSGNGLTFDESLPNLQRRGRRLTELLLDEAAHADDTIGPGFHTAGLVNFRSGDDPVQYDFDIIRRKLVGGLAPGMNYFLYGLGDEASLRHRGLLVPYDRRNDRPPSACGYCTVDRALPGSLLWSRRLVVGTTSYDPNQEPRWSRLNANYEPFGNTTTYEGYDDAGGLGWRTLLREDEPFAIRRPMFTTVSHEVVPAPPGLLGALASGLPTTPILFKNLDPGQVDPTQPFTMSWLGIDPTTEPPTSLPSWMRFRPLDINMSKYPTDPDKSKADTILRMAAALYVALDGVSEYQGFPMDNPMPVAIINPPGTINVTNREYFSWQFALNMADYRDADNVPTRIEFPANSGHYLYGVEKQLFITEAYAFLLAGQIPGSGPQGQALPPDEWFFAAEVFVPPYWTVPTDKLYFKFKRRRGTLVPLSSFTNVNSNQPLPASLSGGTAGAYYVFINDVRKAPQHLGVTNFANFYQNSAFEIGTRAGRGFVQLLYSDSGAPGDLSTHTLDIISPEYSGGLLADGTPSGEGAFAVRDPALPVGAMRDFSLLRSTTGWRFTTGWQVYAEGPLMGQNLPNIPPVRQSLGRPNLTPDLDEHIPESIWPARVTTTGATPPGFDVAQPYSAFDSAGEISRMLMIGPVRLIDGRPPPDLNLPAAHMSQFGAPTILARLLDQDNVTDLPGNSAERIAAGRVDFFPPPTANDPWARRLLSLLTTQSPLYDGIDNDGDTFTDREADATEGADVLFRVAGRININTAPLPVLRSVPFMSMLPSSPEYLFHMSPTDDPFTVFANDAAAHRLWDFASAIIARRENRIVPLRLWNSTDGMMRNVAIAARDPRQGSYQEGAASGVFATVGDLAELSRLVDLSPAGRNDLFRPDRFTSDPAAALFSHMGDPLSPDFRVRPGSGQPDSGVIDYVPMVDADLTDNVDPASNPLDAGGIRGRDVFLTRWANLLTTRSDVYTAYIALIDEDGNTVQRCQVTLDRSDCFRETPGQPRAVILPKVLARSGSSYTDDTR